MASIGQTGTVDDQAARGQEPPKLTVADNGRWPPEHHGRSELSRVRADDSATNGPQER